MWNPVKNTTKQRTVINLVSSQIDKLYFFMIRLRPIPLKMNEDGVERVTGWYIISIRIF